MQGRLLRTQGGERGSEGKAGGSEMKELQCVKGGVESPSVSNPQYCGLGWEAVLWVWKAQGPRWTSEAKNYVQL